MPQADRARLDVIIPNPMLNYWTRYAEGLHYAAVGQAVSGFRKRLQKGGELPRQLKKLEQDLPNV